MTSQIEHFQLPLKALDTRLQEAGLSLKLVIVGAFALNLLNISGQFTADLHRGEFEKKDLEDLQRLAPTKAEIDFAIDFVRLTSTPPEPDLFPEFESVITEIRNVAT
jgi:hypothetical protein